MTSLENHTLEYFCEEFLNFLPRLLESPSGGLHFNATNFGIWKELDSSIVSFEYSFIFTSKYCGSALLNGFDNFHHLEVRWFIPCRPFR